MNCKTYLQVNCASGINSAKEPHVGSVLMNPLEALFTGPSVFAREHSEAIKQWVRKTCDSAPETVILVKQTECRDPRCPGLETVIAVFEERRSRLFKIRAPTIAQKSYHFRRVVGTDPRLADTKTDTKRVKFGSKR